MIESPSIQRWRGTPDLVWIQYSDSVEWVVYNPASSEVHLFNESAQRLWALAADGQARSLNELAAVISQNPAEPPSDEAVRLTQETLDFMDTVGLLRPQPC